MGKKADTSGRPDDPDLAPDAALAEDLGDEEERRKTQLAFYGGEDDEIDSFDPEGLDDGSNLDFKPEEKEEGDEKKDDGEEGEEAGEAEGEADAGEKSGEGDEEEADEGDEEEADEGDEEEADEGDQDDEPKASRQQQGIPKSRFDEVNERRKAAEKELAEIKARQKAEEEAEKKQYDYDKGELEYMELLLDGKTDEALAKRKEIDAARRAEWKAETKQEATSEVSQRESERELTSLTLEAEKMFPIFDKNHGDFNPAITGKVITYMRGYIASDDSLSTSEAFIQALADVVDQYGLDEKYGLGEAKVDDPKPNNEPKPTGGKKVDKDKEKARKRAHQPASRGGQGSADAGVVVPNIMEMSDSDLDKLSEEQIARLRGDYI